MEGSQRPIILLLGAKSLHRPLPAIPEELSTLKTIFEAHQTGTLPQYDIKYEPFFTQKHLKTWLDDFADHIAILHFAGHSGPRSIQTDDSVVRAEDIAAHINTWTRRPDLVFLNGCQNQSQAQTFLDAGVSAVVATQRAVDDKLAANFAREYYHSLLAQNGNTSLTAALEQAKAKLGFEQNETSRSLDIDEGTTQANSWNWDLFLKDTEQAHLSLHKLLTLNRPQYDDAGKLITPYQGLAAFKEEDQDFFFGREQLTGQLVNTIEETPFLVLLGSSGSGKSSLINAGIIPKLRLTKDYLIFKTRPGNDPFAEIARCITQHLYPEKSQLSQRLRESKQLTADYQLNPEHLAEFLQVCLQESGKRRLVLFIDQFEELFTHSDSEAAKVAVKQYETALAELVTNAADTVTLVLVMRADFLGIALTHQTLAILLDRYSQYSKYLSPMSSAELRSVILYPAAKQGVRIEDGLSDQLLTELEKNPESLPLLQHVLSLLWQSRDSSTLTLVDYTRLGGIETALETQANQFLDSLESPEQREQVKRIFLRLINLGEGQDDTRRRADMAEFGTEPDVEILLRQLAEQRLVATQGDDSQNAFVEVTHEALIRSWSRLKEWINEDRGKLRIQHQVSKAAKDWVEHGHDESWLLSGSRLAAADEWLIDNKSIASESEKRLLKTSKAKEKRKKNRIISAVALVIILLTGFAVFAGFQWNIAIDEKLTANYNLIKAYEQKSLLSISHGNDLAQDSPFSPKARDAYRNALLYALEAQIPPLHEGKIPISQTSLGYVSALQNHTLTSPKMETPRINLGGVNVIAYSPNGRIIASGSTDKTIRLWDSWSGQALQTIKGHSKAILTLDYSPNGKFIASGSADSTIRIWDSVSLKHLSTLKGHSSKVMTIAYSPDGNFIVSGSADKTIRFWDAHTFRHIKTLKGHFDDILAITYSPDGKLIASGSADKTIRFWDAQTFEIIKTLNGHTDDVNTLTFNPQGNRIASGSADNTIQLWDTKSFDHIKTLNSHAGSVLALDYSPNGKVIASGSTDRTIRLWDTQKFEPINTLKVHSGDIITLSYSPDGKIITTGGADNTIHLTNPITGQTVHTMQGHSRTVLEVAYHPEGKIFASASSDNTIQIWNAKTLEHIKTLKGHNGYVRTIAFSPDGKTIASGSDDNTISLWDARSLKKIKDFKGHTDNVLRIVYSPNSKTIASGAKDKTIRFWNTKSLQPIRTLPSTGPVQALAYSPDGKVIASSSNDNNIRLWNTQTFENIHIIKAHKEDILTLAYSPNGEILASGSNDDTIKLWNTKSFENIRTLRGHTSYILTVTFSPDGRIIASGSDDNTIHLWSAKTGELLDTLNGLSKNNSSDAVLTLAYSPDGKDLISGSADSTIRLWNAKIMHTPNKLTGHSKTILTITFSPDSKVIASGSNDNTIRLWNAQSGKLIRPLKGHSRAVFALSYSPDGKVIASGSSDKTIRLWDAHSGELIDTLNKGHSETILTLDFSHDGKLLASGSADSTIQVWDTQDYDKARILSEHSGTVLTLAFSPDKQLLASGSADNTIQLWNAQTLEHLGTFEGHSGTVLTLTFSHDSKMIASGAADNTIRLWEVKDFKHIKTLEGHTGSIRSLGYSKNGKTLISASDDNTIRFWNTQSYKNIETLEEHSGKFKALGYSSDGKTLASGYDNNIIRLWRLNTPMFRFIHDFNPMEVSGALRFLWGLELDGLEFKHTPRPQSLFPQLGYHIAWTDETRKFRPLLDMPEGDDSKMDQVVKWLEKRCAYKHPERYDCTPIKD